ncbi:hypothetical protein, partial [Streptobacillus moniliformis]
ANAEIRHVLKSGNYEQYGDLFGDVKVETDANEKVKLTNEAKFELKSILKGTKRETKVELLNN